MSEVLRVIIFDEEGPYVKGTYVKGLKGPYVKGTVKVGTLALRVTGRWWNLLELGPGRGVLLTAGVPTRRILGPHLFCFPVSSGLGCEVNSFALPWCTASPQAPKH